MKFSLITVLLFLKKSEMTVEDAAINAGRALFLTKEQQIIILKFL
jgi:hypothetical protein